MENCEFSRKQQKYINKFDNANCRKDTISMLKNIYKLKNSLNWSDDNFYDFMTEKWEYTKTYLAYLYRSGEFYFFLKERNDPLPTYCAHIKPLVTSIAKIKSAHSNKEMCNSQMADLWVDIVEKEGLSNITRDKVKQYLAQWKKYHDIILNGDEKMAKKRKLNEVDDQELNISKIFSTDDENRSIKASSVRDKQISNFVYTVEKNIVDITKKRLDEKGEIISSIIFDLEATKLPERFRGIFYEKMKNDEYKIEEVDNGKKCIIFW